MARTTAATNANNTYGGQSTQAYNNEQSDIGQYQSNIAKLNAGKNVGANPFQQTGYLSNVNKLQSESLDTAADSGKAAMQRWNRATGGLNSSEVPLAQRDISLQTGRLADTLSAQRSASDYKSNLAWQQYLAGAPLSAASAEGGAYSTATGGQGNALNNLTNLSGQQYGFYGGLLGSAMQGAGIGFGGAFSGGGKGCWIAAAVFDEDFYTGAKTNLVRNWLWNEWAKHWYAKPVLGLYSRFGQRAAKSCAIVRLLSPLFHIALRKATT
jgi:hypothetical protein